MPTWRTVTAYLIGGPLHGERREVVLRVDGIERYLLFPLPMPARFISLEDALTPPTSALHTVTYELAITRQQPQHRFVPFRHRP